MITMSENWAQDITAPARYMYGRVEISARSPLTFLPTDKLVSIKVEKTSVKGKFFGFTVAHKATVVLLDSDESIYEYLTGYTDSIYTLKVFLGTPTEQVGYPLFYIEDVSKDEVKKTITLTCYDGIQEISKYSLKDIDYENLSYQTSLDEILKAMLTVLNSKSSHHTLPADLSFLPMPPNFNGDENLRDVLTYMAEALGGIIYIDQSNYFTFKRLSDVPVYTIDKSQFFEFSKGSKYYLNRVSHVTDLGENYSTSTSNYGFNQILRNNPFIENRADIQEVLDAIVNLNYRNSTYSYNLKWRGNPALEIGDYVTIDDVNVYYMGETLEYKGGLVVTSEWAPLEEEPVDATPRNLGEAVRQTFARVDKVNAKIDLMASDITEAQHDITQLKLSSDGITASVESIEKLIEENNSKTEQDIEEINKKVEATMSAEDVRLEISSALNDGVNKVTTSTGFTFNQDGLTVSKSGSEMTTQITEDGMTVYRDNMEVLVADNVGVTATNLHARTYLIIGNNSRLEDYVDANYEPRTGCFWIGG